MESAVWEEYPSQTANFPIRNVWYCIFCVDFHKDMLEDTETFIQQVFTSRMRQRSNRYHFMIPTDFVPNEWHSIAYIILSSLLIYFCAAGSESFSQYIIA